MSIFRVVSRLFGSKHGAQRHGSKTTVVRGMTKCGMENCLLSVAALVPQTPTPRQVECSVWSSVRTLMVAVLFRGFLPSRPLISANATCLSPPTLLHPRRQLTGQHALQSHCLCFRF